MITDLNRVAALEVVGERVAALIPPDEPEALGDFRRRGRRGGLNVAEEVRADARDLLLAVHVEQVFHLHHLARTRHTALDALQDDALDLVAHAKATLRAMMGLAGLARSVGLAGWWGLAGWM